MPAREITIINKLGLHARAAAKFVGVASTYPCQARGLSGEQGVIIPRANVSNLMLDERVLQAVHAGQFHVFAVSHADQALSLLAGEAAGEADAQGNFPEGSLNARVVARLREIAEQGLDDDNDKAEEAPVSKSRRTRQPAADKAKSGDGA